jgi:hypothetical protein
MILFWRYFFLTWLVGTVFYAVLRGGWSERTAILIIAVGSILSVIAAGTYAPDWHRVLPGIIFVDIQTMAAFLLLALVSNRLWTAWAAGFQLPIIAIDFWPFFMDDISPKVLSYSEVFWTYPTFVAILLGTRTYQRAQKQKNEAS